MQSVDNLRTKITEYDAAYRAGNPLISDEEYDRLVAEASEQAGEDLTPDLNDDAGVTGEDVKLNIPMGSQQKALTYEELQAWLNARGFDQNTMFNVSVKMDGISAEVTYTDGKLTRVATRGNGFIGKDITALVRNLFPQTVPTPGQTVVRAEIFLPRKNLPIVNERLVARGREPFKNCRNSASSIARTPDLQFLVDLLDYRAFYLHEGD